MSHGIASASPAVPIRGGVDRALGVLAVHDTRVRDYPPADVLYLRQSANVLGRSIRGAGADGADPAPGDDGDARRSAHAAEIGRRSWRSGASSVGAAAGSVAEVSAGGDSSSSSPSFGYDEARAGEY